jgi:hypothetical protein
MTDQQNNANDTVATLDQENKNHKSTTTTLNQAISNTTKNTAEPSQQPRSLAKLEAAGTESSTNQLPKDPEGCPMLQMKCGNCGGSMGSYARDVLKSWLPCSGVSILIPSSRRSV